MSARLLLPTSIISDAVEKLLHEFRKRLLNLMEQFEPVIAKSKEEELYSH